MACVSVEHLAFDASLVPPTLGYMFSATWLGWLSAVLAFAAAKPGALAPEAWPGTTATFEFNTERYLLGAQKNGGMVYVTDGVGEGAEAALVVFLHGLNDKRSLHPWMTGDPGDLRPIMNALVRDRKTVPFLLAAPTQSRNAMIPKILWPDFNLDAFVAAVDDALEGRARVRANRVIVVGHSGGACNPKGGAIGAAANGSREGARIVPIALLSVDSCLDPEIVTSILEAPSSTKAWVYWQRATWPRHFEEFRQKLEGAPFGIGPEDRHCEEVMGLKVMPHNAILPAVLEHALPELLPPDAL
jgi:pimeloyl-ACP methyl ester carboxylesterase